MKKNKTKIRVNKTKKTQQEKIKNPKLAQIFIGCFVILM